MFNALGVPKTLQEVQAVVQEVDDDGSGEIEFDEFVKIMEGDKKQLTEDELKSEFMNMTTMTLPDEGSGKPEVITIMNMRAIADLLGEEKTDEELQVRIAGTALPLHAVVALWSRHQRVVLVRAGHRPCLLRRARNSRNHRLTLVLAIVSSCRKCWMSWTSIRKAASAGGSSKPWLGRHGSGVSRTNTWCLFVKYSLEKSEGVVWCWRQ